MISRGPWDAPVLRVPLDAHLTIPGSKSLTARHLIVAATATGPSTIRGALRSRDTDLMIDALRAMGTDIEGDGSTLSVTPAPLASATIDVGLAGTVFRFLSALSLASDARLSFHGDEAMSKRPITPLLDALASLGVEVDGTHLPLSLRGPARGSVVELDAGLSSQFVSALLLAAPSLPEGLTIRHVGTQLPSQPHIDMTVDVLRSAGAHITQPNPTTWVVEPSPLTPGDVLCEPDLSNATPFLAAAAVSSGRVTIDWPELTTQPGQLILPILEDMGARVTQSASAVTVERDALHGADIDLRAAGELAPTVAALATLADSPSTLTGIAHLRGHETDRLAALATEIRRLGAGAEELDDGLRIEPAPLTGTMVRTYGDHRMATFGAIIGLVTPGTVVEDIGATAKTLPTFTQLWQEMIG